MTKHASSGVYLHHADGSLSYSMIQDIRPRVDIFRCRLHLESLKAMALRSYAIYLKAVCTSP